jgi:peptidoglycan/xylan/chitin deacetylase (PgdA/CDA1 family)
MMSLHSMKRKFHVVWEKNSADLRSVLNGRLPALLGKNGERALPVFVYHRVEPVQFESQLRYLAENGYSSLTGKELLGRLALGEGMEQKQVALTFDDATGSAWTVAFPLLKKYGFRAILFAIPGLTPEAGILSPNLEDVWAGDAELPQVLSREADQPLCSWEELIVMERSGVFDIQSHSLTHSRIFTGNQLMDFINPWFDTYFYKNINLPVYRDEPAEAPVRTLRFGRPIYATVSRLSGHPRLLENSRLVEQLEAHVQQNGAERFFERADWRRELEKLHYDLLEQCQPAFEYETRDETEAALRKEMAESKRLLEGRLEKEIDHLCYPWYQGSPPSDRIAAECGYRAVYYGLEYAENSDKKNVHPHQVRRISEEYLHCLPGRGQSSVPRVWADKVYQSVRKRRLV